MAFSIHPFWYGSLLLLLIACNNRPTQTAVDTIHGPDFNFTVERATEWDKLFIRNKGWLGGDGIFSIALNGREIPDTSADNPVLVWFSDTILGTIENDSLRQGMRMINNSLLLLNSPRPDSNLAQFYWPVDKKKNPGAVFRPATSAATTGEYYWLGDGFVNKAKQDSIYIFGYRIKNIPGKAVFGFQQTGTTLIKLPPRAQLPFEQTTQLDLPFFQGLDQDSAGAFGAGILVNSVAAGIPNGDGYVYVYGIRGNNKEVMVARFKPENVESFSDWHFWNGSSWSGNVSAIAPIADSASNEMSVTALPDGRYLMLFQRSGLDTRIGIRLGPSPWGPFGPIIDIFDTREDLQASPQTLFTYNAKAHPVLSHPGQLLVSYNLNSFDFNNDIRKYPHLYRPRFITLRY